MVNNAVATVTVGPDPDRFSYVGSSPGDCTGSSVTIVINFGSPPSPPNPSPPSTLDSGLPQTFELSLTPEDGTVCPNSSQSATGGSWVTLPLEKDCTPPAAKAGATLLGWATTPNFPVVIAQRQVSNGWGTYESFNDAGQIVAVFIPAGRATFLSGSNTLYAIWNK
jgi:hypothetical protein